MQTTIDIPTRGPGLYEFTSQVRDFVRGTSVRLGLLTLFVQHTSCSIVVQENADPDVQRDLAEFFGWLAPRADDPSMSWIRHRAEGPDDMPAHLKAAITATSLSIPFEDGRLLMGTWQGIYLLEHRRAPHRRRIVATIIAGD